MKLLQSFCFLFIICISIQVSAQQSSKTKAANKLYEKGGEVEIINATPINTSNLEFPEFPNHKKRMGELRYSSIVNTSYKQS